MTNAIMKVLSSIICLSLALLSGVLAFYGHPDIPVGAVKGDRFSPLDGPALVKAKVKALYVMGGGRVARSVSKGSVNLQSPLLLWGC